MKYIANLSIRNKLLVFAIIISTFIAISIALSTYYYVQTVFRNDLMDNLKLDARFLSDLCITGVVFNDSAGVADELSHLHTKEWIEKCIIYDMQNKPFAVYFKKAELQNVGGTDIIKTTTTDIFELYQPLELDKKQFGSIYMEVNLDYHNTQIDRILYIILGIALVAIFLSLLLSYLFQRFISVPITKLSRITNQIKQTHNYDISLQHEGTDEVSDLYDNFNEMILEIGQRVKERDGALSRLALSEERFRQMATSANDAIVAFDSAGHITFWNKAAENIYGYTTTEIMGEEANILFGENTNQFFGNYISTLPDSNGGVTEILSKNKNGAAFDAEISMARFLIADSPQALAIIKDISMRKQTETELREAKRKAEESDKLKSAFLANMSHEIRTPMNAIIGFTDLMKRSDLTEEKRQQFIEVIHKNAGILMKLIEDILDISKIEAGQLAIKHTSTRILPLVNDIIRNFEQIKVLAGKNDLEVRTAADPKANYDYAIVTDENRLRQILSNLVNNAIKFTESGFVELGFKLLDKSALFWVRDTGIGMTSQQLEIIFERFRQVDNTSTRKYDGAGLGLAISKGLADLLNGRIWANAILGSGSVFYFELPFNHEDTIDFGPVSIGFDDEVKKDKSKTVLIVEDEVSNYEFLKETLMEFDNLNILWARDGIPAVELCKNNPNIDLVLMDIQMPEMDGYEATRLIKKLRPDLPIVAQTAFSMEGERDKSLNAGCDAYIAKPIKFQELLKVIKFYLFKNLN